MFNLRLEDLFPRLRVEPPPADEVPGFNLNPDGSAGDTRRSAASGTFRFDPGASPSPSIGTGLQDAMPFAAGNTFPVTYLSSGLPDFAPPPRHPLQDALDEIMRIYAGVAQKPSGPFVQQGSGGGTVSSTIGRTLSPYAGEPQPLEPSMPAPLAWPDISDNLPMSARPLGTLANNVADFDVGPPPTQAPEGLREPDGDPGSSLPWLQVNPPPLPDSTVDPSIRKTADESTDTTETGALPRLTSVASPAIQPLKEGQTQTSSGNSGDPWRAAAQQQQTPLPEELQTRLNNVPGRASGSNLVDTQPTPRIDAPSIVRSVYNPDVDGGYDDLFDLVGVKENKAQGDAARDAEAARIKKAYPDAGFAKEIRIYAEGAPDHMTADILFRANGTSVIMVTEVKSGDGRLTSNQLAKLAEAVRTGGIYIVNPEAAKELGIRPRETFGSQRILPQVYVVGGNHDVIARQLRSVGLEVYPERGRRGQPPRLRVGAPPT